MDASAFGKTPKPSLSNPSDPEDPGNLSDDDHAFSADLREVPHSNEAIRAQNLSVLQLYSQPSRFLSTKPTIFGPQFRFLSRTASPVASRSATPIPLSSSSLSQVQTVKIFKVPDNVKKTNEQGLRILAIDNGGICTFSTLYMLEVVMLEVGNLLDVPDGEETRPCDVFDLICGTSTGGWIALMLGRLGMTVRECIRAYEQIVQHVFSEVAPLSNEGYVYSAKKLEAVLQEIITRHAPSSISSSPLPMKDAAIGDRCRTFVVSRYESNGVVSTQMRTYNGPDAVHSAARCTVLEAARATSSACQFFPPIVIDNTRYVTIRDNNPAAIAIDEANRIWGQGSEVACLVSLGSGIGPAVNWGTTKREIELAVKAIVEDCSQVAGQLKMKMQDRGLGHRYHRFSVHTMGGVKWEEWERTKDVVGRTKAYMEVMGHEVRDAARCLVQVTGLQFVGAYHYRLRALALAAKMRSNKLEKLYWKDVMLRLWVELETGNPPLHSTPCTAKGSSSPSQIWHGALEKISVSGFAATTSTPLLNFRTTSATISLRCLSLANHRRKLWEITSEVINAFSFWTILKLLFVLTRTTYKTSFDLFFQITQSSRYSLWPIAEIKWNVWT
ncbi:FabD/lysophospholipase-like protein [Atractiella rhizophila]|nr:FabD/lysophospholipase-like protein [Atractiella rhizophila]